MGSHTEVASCTGCRSVKRDHYLLKKMFTTKKRESALKLASDITSAMWITRRLVLGDIDRNSWFRCLPLRLVHYWEGFLTQSVRKAWSTGFCPRSLSTVVCGTCSADNGVSLFSIQGGRENGWLQAYLSNSTTVCRWSNWTSKLLVIVVNVCWRVYNCCAYADL